MSPIVRLIAVVFFLIYLESVHAAPVHTVTWTLVNASPGTEVTLAGQTFVLVRVPVRPLIGNQHYAVSFLAPVFPQVGPNATLTTFHSTDPLEDPFQIDGFNATATVLDGRSYLISPSIANPDTSSFSVLAQTTCTVQVKVGSTILSFFHVFTTPQQRPTVLGETLNALPVADWDAYVHPSAQVRACDEWIDYIRIRQVQ